MTDEGEDITEWDAYDDIRDEGIEHQLADFLYTSEGIGEGYLHTIAKLIDEEAWNERHDDCSYFIARCETCDEWITEYEYQGYHYDANRYADVKCRISRATHIVPVANTTELTYQYTCCSSYAIDNLEAERRDCTHNLVSGEWYCAKPSHEDRIIW